MGKLTISMHMSLDGYVAGSNGEMDWIYVNDEIFDYVKQLTDNANVALYGRTTFQMMDSYWPTAGDAPNASRHAKDHSAWYNRVQKLVLSNTLTSRDKDKVTFLSSDMLDVVAETKQRENIAVFGSPGAIHTLFEKELVDEMYLFINPIVLGHGAPLFKGIHEKIKWKLVEVKTFEGCDVVGMRYARA